MAKPSVNTNPIANNYVDGTVERVVEFHNGVRNSTGHAGGLISLRRLEDNTLDVLLYKLDAGVRVHVSRDGADASRLRSLLVQAADYARNGYTPGHDDIDPIELLGSIATEYGLLHGTLDWLTRAPRQEPPTVIDIGETGVPERRFDI